MTAETPQDGTEALDPSQDTGEGSEDPTEPQADPVDGNGREARYRIRARDAEKERDELRATNGGLRARLAETYVNDRLCEVSDLWRHTNVNDLCDEHGDIDPEKVTAAVDAIEQNRPHLIRRRGPAVDRSLGSSSRNPNIGNGWQGLLRGLGGT